MKQSIKIRDYQQQKINITAMQDTTISTDAENALAFAVNVNLSTNQNIEQHPNRNGEFTLMEFYRIRTITSKFMHHNFKGLVMVTVFIS